MIYDNKNEGFYSDDGQFLKSVQCRLALQAARLVGRIGAKPVNPPETALSERGATHYARCARWSALAATAYTAGVLNTWMSRSLIFFRSVFLFNPSSAAARIWLPRVAASAAISSGRSTCCKIRS
jgi:hypothetical protein